MNSIFNFLTTKKKPIFFIKSILFLLVALVSFHATIWHLFTKELLATPYPYQVGDLSRLSYQTSSIYKRKINDINLSKKHIEMRDWHGENIDIITIGDSFSNGGGGGKNPFYQDYIATQTGKNILNISSGEDGSSFAELALMLNNNGLLKEMKVKAIILESVQRYAVGRYTQDINWDINNSKNNFLNTYKSIKTPPHKQSGITFINNGNYHFVLNNILYSLSKKPYKKDPVYMAKLTKNMFSIKAKDTLLFYHEDINKIPDSTKQNIKKLNSTLNKLAKKLKKSNIKLIFMPAVDKYNLYYPYIKNNNLPKSNFFSLLRKLKKDYIFIDTKAILQPLLEKNIKDVFYSDDTHWSYKASKKVINSVAFDDIL